ncbi:MAG: cytochrome c, partial [Verrucomicrobia bacterium]|nr:cytochrome c [Verrucomicrobiota bacterium]
DVAPVFYKNCVTCHRPGEVAPFSLLSYKEARPWVKSIREKVSQRVMPPWHADAHYGPFRNDRRLSDKDIATILAWVDGGAKEGDPKDLPPVPEVAEGWHIGKPDAVYSIPVEYEVPASGVVEYQYFTVPTNFKEDKWLQSAEIHFGDRSVVHHAIVFVHDPKKGPSFPAGLRGRMDLMPPAPKNPETARIQTKLGTLLHGSAPGEQSVEYAPGHARLIPAGAELIFQLHYTPNGKASKDRTSVGIKFASEAPEWEERTVGVMNGKFAIPAGEANYRVESSATFTEDAEITALFPHMHLRGKSFEYRAVYPDGRSQILLEIPQYDFNWQSGYMFATPVKIPKGTRLECTAYFDNSTGNKWNPDATKPIYWGDQTWEEMMIGWTTYSVRTSKKTSLD